MAAGLGFKDFTTGEVLTAADVDGYLMQGVWVFASAAARDAAVTSPQEGNFAYLKDTNVTTYYTGSAWANLDTTGMTNPMTTTGDIIYSSPGSTPVRLGIGSTGNVLTVSGGVPAWAAPATSSFVGVRVFRSTTQSVNNDTATEITFDSESWDTNSFHSTSSDTGRITIPVGQAGKYIFELGFQYDANATGVRQFNLYKNGSSIREFTNNTVSAGVTAYSVSYIYDCAESDYFQFYTYQNSGGTRTLASGTDKTYFSAYKVG